MRRFNKKRFSTWQVVIMLTIAFVGIVGIGYALTVPNEFDPDTTISSSQVNNNFTTIANAIPGINAKCFPSLAISLSDTARTVIDLKVTAPTDGYFWIHYSGVSMIRHTTGINDLVRFVISENSSPYIVMNPSFSIVGVVGAQPTGSFYCNSVSTQRLFEVTSGAHAFYVHADLLTGSDATLRYNYITGIFIPDIVGNLGPH